MTTIYQLKIEIEGSKPSVWRRIQIDAETIFSEFHDIIQIVFQAEFNSEEYEFNINNVRIFDFGAEIDTGKNPELKDSNETFLDEYVNLTGMQFTYTCDSDDQLKFSIILEKIETDAENIELPRCIDGNGPSLGFDPARFDLEEVNKEIMQYKDAWGEIYDETEKIIGNELYEEDVWSEEEDEPEYENDYYEGVKNFKQPGDLLNDELEKSDMEHWLEDNLYDHESLEFETHQRLIKEGYPEKEAKNLLLECLAIEWFSELKYGTKHLDERYTYNLNRLPAKPLEIPNLDYALQVLETATKGLPFQAIEYLHDHASPETTSAIVNALNNHSDHQYCWGNCQFAPIWYAIAAEGHLQEVMIDPVIDLCKKNHNETDWLLEQAEFLIGKLAMNYPELTAAKVLDALEKDAEEGTDHNLFFLFDCFYFCDLALHKERLMALLKHTNVCWHEPLISTLAIVQVKEALPIIKQQMAELQASDPSGNYIEYKEAIQELEMGEIKYPEVSMPICLKRENSWRKEYEPYEDGFYPDDDAAFYDALENSFDMPWNKQEPVVVGTKVGRNDPCPCGSGKKYKKCCLGKDDV